MHGDPQPVATLQRQPIQSPSRNTPEIPEMPEMPTAHPTALVTSKQWPLPRGKSPVTTPSW